MQIDCSCNVIVNRTSRCSLSLRDPRLYSLSPNHCIWRTISWKWNWNGKAFRKLMSNPTVRLHTFAHDLLTFLSYWWEGVAVIDRRCFLRSADIEKNPRPLSAEQKTEMFEVILQIPLLVRTQADILNEIRSIRSDQPAIGKRVTDVAAKMLRVEMWASSILPLKVAAENISTHVEQPFLPLRQMTWITDNEGANLIIYGITGATNGRWAESEERVVPFLFANLNILVSPTSTERAHRLERQRECSHWLPNFFI